MINKQDSGGMENMSSQMKAEIFQANIKESLLNSRW